MERDCGAMEEKPKDSFDYPHYWNYYYDFDIQGMMPIKELVSIVWGFVDEAKEKYADKKIEYYI